MALFYQKGTISDFSEVQKGTTQSGKEWQRMNLILDTPGFQGSVYKMVFQVSGEKVKEVLLYSRGDKVEVGFSMYAREWNGKWYNNVDLVKIAPLEVEKQEVKATITNERVVVAPTPTKESDDNPEGDLPF